jgi:hypothetical protein
MFHQQQGGRMVISLQHEILAKLKIILIYEWKKAVTQQHNQPLL